MEDSKYAIISCAGIGSRLGLNKVKCLLKINEKSLISRLLNQLNDFEIVFLVVGFQSKDVIRHVEKGDYKNVVFVFNHDYRNTGNLYSINRVLKHIHSDNILIIDGDLLIDENSMSKIKNKISRQPNENFVCITDTKSEDAVCVKIVKNCVTKFTFKNKLDFEWCGVAYLKRKSLLKVNDYINKTFVCTILDKILPIESLKINCYEFDTPKDLSDFNFLKFPFKR